VTRLAQGSAPGLDAPRLRPCCARITKVTCDGVLTGWCALEHGHDGDEHVGNLSPTPSVDRQDRRRP
jgi:hypothetical protein